MSFAKTWDRPGDGTGEPAVDSMNGWRFAMLLAAVTLASYQQVIFGLQTFVYRDFGYFSYPVAYYFRERFWQGELPLWNPLGSCGVPFLAQWNTQILYPPALLYLLVPISYSLGLFCVLHLFFGGLGMFFLARRWTGSGFAGAFAGVVFAFGGLSLNSLTLPPAIAGLSWMPWVVWLVELSWKKGGTSLVIGALAGALQMLSGAVEIILLTWLLIGAVFLACIVQGSGDRSRAALRAGVVILLITGICAAQLLPFFELLRYSQRISGFSPGDWPMPPSGWLNFLVPIFNCRTYMGGVFMQPGQNWTSGYYVGAATLVLAVLAIRRPRLLTGLLTASVFLSLILALGNVTPIYDWLCRHVSVVALMRYPIKFVIVPAFVLPWLAAWGIATLFQTRADRPGSPLRAFLWLVSAIVFSAILGLVWWSYQFRVSENDWKAICINGTWRAVLFAMIVGGLVVLPRVEGSRLVRPMQFLLLLLVWFDLYSQAPQPAMVKAAIYEPYPDRFATETPALGVARAMLPPSVQNRFYHSFLPDLVEDYLSRRSALLANCNLLDNVPKCDDFLPLDLACYEDLFPADPRDPLLDFLGVSQLLSVREDRFGWEVRSNAMPMLTCGAEPIFGADKDALRWVTGPEFAPRSKVFLPLKARSFIHADGAASVRILSRTIRNERIEATVEASAPAMIVMAQTRYPAWRAYVDNRRVELWPANYAFQAVEVPAGRHQVLFRYEDGAFRTGAWISLASLAATGILGVSLRRGRVRQRYAG